LLQGDRCGKKQRSPQLIVAAILPKIGAGGFEPPTS
jgi:hypothetical protein